MADAAPVTWTHLHRRVSELEAEVTQRESESSGTTTRLERELSQAKKREAELTRQLQTTELKLKRTERLLIKPGYSTVRFISPSVALSGISSGGGEAKGIEGVGHGKILF